MPVLKNAKHEMFAKGLAEGLTADEAYQRAGFKPNRGNAIRLKANENILKRIDEIRSRVAEKAEWTAADRLRDLKSIFDRTSDKDERVAISAISEANKMQGSYAPAKHEHKGRFTVVNVTPEQLGRLNSDELAVLEAAYPVLEKLGVVSAGNSGGEAGEGSEQED
ncbi:terminase [Ochrobactrum vermis]|nr:terminase [Ochrobactrum vermis]